MSAMHPDNQAPDLKDYNVYTSDPALLRAIERAGAMWRDDELVRQGSEYGSAAILRAAEEANRFDPQLKGFSRSGERLDAVDFHPAWHIVMTIARRNGIANLPYVDARPSAWAAYGASLYMHSQIESGSTCPTIMTKACIPVLQRNAALFEMCKPKLWSMTHEPADVPLAQKKLDGCGHGDDRKTRRQRFTHQHHPGLTHRAGALGRRISYYRAQMVFFCPNVRCALAARAHR